jgi:hypothetical protein
MISKSSLSIKFDYFSSEFVVHTFCSETSCPTTVSTTNILRDFLWRALLFRPLASSAVHKNARARMGPLDRWKSTFSEFNNLATYTVGLNIYRTTGLRRCAEVVPPHPCVQGRVCLLCGIACKSPGIINCLIDCKRAHWHFLRSEWILRGIVLEQWSIYAHYRTYRPARQWPLFIHNDVDDVDGIFYYKYALGIQDFVLLRIKPPHGCKTSLQSLGTT